MPYHRYGTNKYNLLGWKYALEDLQSPKKDDMEKLQAIGRDMGLIIQIDG